MQITFPDPTTTAGRILFCLARSRAVTPRHVACDRDLPRFLTAIDELRTSGWGVFQPTIAQRWQLLDARHEGSFSSPEAQAWLKQAADAARRFGSNVNTET